VAGFLAQGSSGSVSAIITWYGRSRALFTVAVFFVVQPTGALIAALRPAIAHLDRYDFVVILAVVLAAGRSAPLPANETYTSAGNRRELPISIALFRPLAHCRRDWRWRCLRPTRKRLDGHDRGCG